MKTLLSLVCLLSMAVPSFGAITVNYNNATGAFQVSGSESGDGGAGSYLSQFSSDAIRDDFMTVFQSIITAGGVSGTQNGVAITSITSSGGSSSIGGYTIFGSGFFGAVSLDPTSGTIAGGQTSIGNGTYIATGIPGEGTVDGISFTVVPESSAYALVAAFVAILTVVHRRRLAA